LDSSLYYLLTWLLTEHSVLLTKGKRRIINPTQIELCWIVCVCVEFTTQPDISIKSILILLGNYWTQFIFHISLVAQFFWLRTTKLNLNSWYNRRAHIRITYSVGNSRNKQTCVLSVDGHYVIKTRHCRLWPVCSTMWFKFLQYRSWLRSKWALCKHFYNIQKKQEWPHSWLPPTCQHTAHHLLGLCSCPWFLTIWVMKLCRFLINSFPPSRWKLGASIEIALADIIDLLSQNCKKHGHHTCRTILWLIRQIVECPDTVLLRKL
jgi:hypothetical protein